MIKDVIQRQAHCLFVSSSAFTPDGLVERGLSLNDVLARKVRRAAETGLPFERVRDIFGS